MFHLFGSSIDVIGKALSSSVAISEPIAEDEGNGSPDWQIHSRSRTYIFKSIAISAIERLDRLHVSAHGMWNQALFSR